MTAERLRYRRATADDSRACHDLLWTSVVVDLGRRQGSPLEGTADDWWRTGESLHSLLTQLAAEWWVAEESHAYFGEAEHPFRRKANAHLGRI